MVRQIAGIVGAVAVTLSLVFVDVQVFAKISG
jgi:hypothetical protein